MKKIFLLIQLAALTGALPAFALVGGPFDNGDYSVLDERSGFYESSFSYTNGNGYAIWTADSLVGTTTTGTTVSPNVGSGSLFTPATNLALTNHNGNRSVLYYKGVTYFGSALGEVDVSARTIQGFCNASSEFQATSTTTNSSGTSIFFGQQNTTVANSSNVVSSGRSYVLNLSWTGKITATAPQLRFSGSGEMAIIAPNGNEAVAGLAYSGFSGLVSAINASVSGTTIVIGNNSLYTQAETAIANALAALTPYLTGTGPTNSYNGSEVQTVQVTGYRRYF